MDRLSYIQRRMFDNAVECATMNAVELSTFNGIVAYQQQTSSRMLKQSIR